MLKLGGTLFAGVANQEISKEATGNTRQADAIEEVADIVGEIDYCWFGVWHIHYIQDILNIIRLHAVRHEPMSSLPHSRRNPRPLPVDEGDQVHSLRKTLRYSSVDPTPITLRSSSNQLSAPTAGAVRAGRGV